MATISLSDEIFATLHLRGNSVTSLRIKGVSSFAEILSRLIKSAPALCRGMATVEIRNGSQGWAARRAVMLSRA